MTDPNHLSALDVIQIRRSVRKYQKRTVAIDLIGQVLEAGRMAPTAGNLQNYKIILVREKSGRDAIAAACHDQHWMARAPVHLVVVSEPQRARQFYYERGEKVYSIQNAAAIAMNMEIAATALGLGSCWVGSFDEDAVRGACGIPDYNVPYVIITLGYAEEKPNRPDKYKLWDMVFLERWEARIRDIPSAVREPSISMEKRIRKNAGTMQESATELLSRLREKSTKVKEHIQKKVKSKRKNG